MIRFTSGRRHDTLSDAVWRLRAFGSVFVLTGTCALTLALSGSDGLNMEGLGARVVVGCIGAMHLLAGLVAGWRAWHRNTISRGGVEHTVHRLLRPRVTRHIAPSEVRDVLIVPEADSDGDDQFVLVLFLASGERVRLTRNCTQSEERATEIRDALMQRLSLPAPAPAPEPALASGDRRQRRERSGDVPSVSRRPRRASLQP